ncbi:unnamed protein product [Allacma fusca]|uniref:Prolyl 4-hydroxylase alpha subunit domain-containing protein n=1 Tax=Allacma fusca TaxID=39272 RepID=A0A8J2PNU6_9HEXA|nr:unnamed protein product [Allacma fusca]
MCGLSSRISIKIFVLISLTLALFSSSTNCRLTRHFYTKSIGDLKDLAGLDIEISEYFTQVYLASESLNQDLEIKHLVEVYLQDFYETSGFADFSDAILTTAVKISHNPICSYRLIRRAIYLLRHLVLRASFFRIFQSKMARKIFHFFLENGWPSNRDSIESNFAILSIQQAHAFDVDQFANGLLATVQTNCTFDSISCHELRQDMASQIQWLEKAIEKAENDGKTSVPFLKLLLRKAINKHNNVFDADTMLDLQSPCFDRELKHIPGDSKTAKKVHTILYETLQGKQSVAASVPRTNYWRHWALCSGKNFQTEEEKSQLFCWYEFKAHPRFQIGPVKMEFLNRDPDMVQIYEILSEKETLDLIRNTSATMLPSSVQHIDMPIREDQLDPYEKKSRTSVNSWLPRSVDLIASRKIEAITGLHVAREIDSELLQVASYTVGGVFQPHHDELVQEDKDLPGQRIATFMFYFNEVELDGYSDPMVDHGACPVIMGEKWSANKWIHEQTQFLDRKCTLKRKERFQIPCNGVVR